MSNFITIRPVGAELFLADTRPTGQTDGQVYKMKPTLAFRNFANALLIKHFSSTGATKHWHSNSSDINWNETCTNSFTFSANITKILLSKSLR